MLDNVQAPFALTPRDGPPRLIRFEPLPYEGLLSTLDPQNNLLRVDPDLYGQLDNVDRDILIRTLELWTILDKQLRLVPLKEAPEFSLVPKEA